MYRIFSTKVTEIANKERLKRAFSIQKKEKKPVFYVLPSYQWLKTARERQRGLLITTFDDIATFILKQAEETFLPLSEHERSLFFQQFIREEEFFEHSSYLKVQSYSDTYGQVKRLGLSVDELPKSLASLTPLFKNYENSVVKKRRLYDPENRILRAIDRLQTEKVPIARVIIDGYFDFSPLQALLIEAIKKADIPMELYVPNDEAYPVVEHTVSELKSIGFTDNRETISSSKRVKEKEMIAATTEEEQWRGVMEEIRLSGEPLEKFGILLVDEKNGMKLVERYSEMYRIPINLPKRRPLSSTAIYTFLLTLLKRGTIPRTRWEQLPIVEHVLKLFFVQGLPFAKQKRTFLKTGTFLEEQWSNLYDYTTPLISERQERLVDELERVEQWLLHLPVISFWEEQLEKETDLYVLTQLSDEYRAWQQLLTDLGEYKNLLVEKGLQSLHLSRDLFAKWLEEKGEQTFLYKERASKRGLSIFTWRDVALFSGKTLYVIGMNEGLFPKKTHLSGYVKQRDLIESPIRFSPPTETHGRLKQEAHFCQLDYVAETIKFVYVKGVDANHPLLPSPFLAELKLEERLWSVNERMKRPYAFFEQDELEKTAYYAGKGYDVPSLRSNLYNVQERLLRLEKGEEYVQLQNDKKVVSVTELESYARCPFRYGMEKMIAPADVEREQEEVSRLAIGQMIHELIEETYTEFKLIGVPFGQVQKETLDNISSWLIERFEHKWRAIEREHVELSRLELELTKRDWLEFINKWWKAERKRFWDNEKLANMAIVALEKTIELPITINENEELLLVGKVDRVDATDDSFVIYDYKTGRADAKLDDVYTGLKLQLPLYTLAIQKEFQHKKADGATYVEIKDPEKRAGNGIWRPEHIGRQSKYDVHHRAHEEETLGTDEFLEKYKLKERIAELWEGMHSDFSVKPLDCSSFCPYRTVCRVTEDHKEV